MEIKAEFDLTGLTDALGKAEKNLAYSAAFAINETAKEIQAHVRNDIKRQMKLRKGDWLLRQIKISTFANVRANRPYAVIEIAKAKRLLLAGFEAGMDKAVIQDKRATAVPITGRAARPSIGAIVPRDFFSKKRFKKVRTKPGTSQWKGPDRMFILPKTKRAPKGGVFQRTGKGKDDIEMVWAFGRKVKLKRMISLIEDSKSIYARRFKEIFEAKYIANIR